MKKIAWTAAIALIHSSTLGYAQQAPAPPRSVVAPRPIPSSERVKIEPTDPRDAIACLAYDIGEDGHISNVVVYQSTGSPDLDNRIAALWERKSYQPAMIDGVPKKARTMGSYVIGHPLAKCPEDPALVMKKPDTPQ